MTSRCGIYQCRPSTALEFPASQAHFRHPSSTSPWISAPGQASRTWPADQTTIYFEPSQSWLKIHAKSRGAHFPAQSKSATIPRVRWRQFRRRRAWLSGLIGRHRDRIYSSAGSAPAVSNPEPGFWSGPYSRHQSSRCRPHSHPCPLEVPEQPKKLDQESSGEFWFID